MMKRILEPAAQTLADATSKPPFLYELGQNPIVASLSLGAVRTFLLRHKVTREKLIPVGVSSSGRGRKFGRRRHSRSCREGSDGRRRGRSGAGSATRNGPRGESPIRQYMLPTWSRADASSESSKPAGSRRIRPACGARS